MKSLMGADKAASKVIIQDLNVQRAQRLKHNQTHSRDCVNVKTSEEVTKHLVATGKLPHPPDAPSSHPMTPESLGNQNMAVTDVNQRSNWFFPPPYQSNLSSTDLPEGTEGGGVPSRSASRTGLALPAWNMHGASGPVASRDLPGLPTISGPLDPGPYNEANALLRRQLPHYNVKIKVHTAWDQLFVWGLSIVALAAYLGTRFWYLLSGKTAELQQVQTEVSIPYSWATLGAETIVGVVGFYLHQNFWKQETKFDTITSKTLDKITQDVSRKGIRETVHVLITTYTEPAVTVRECVLRLIVAPEPLYMEKMIYVCDDGHSKAEGPKKREMVEELRQLGHTNVFYVGDRIKKPGQLNGKSANLNHVILQKIYPAARKAEDIPVKDVLMVMDCDHMVKPDIFNKMGPCMLDPRMAVCLVPQCFHNLIYPDALDAANGDFMFGRLPYYFGAGVSFVTGTNVMVRAKSCFEVCQYADQNSEASADGEDRRQLFTEDEISEDVVLGSRLHAGGFKGVFIAENLATGEVPLDPRAMWRQRFRWFKGGHLFVLSSSSVFHEKHTHMSFYQKSLYWISLVANLVSVLSDPVLMSLPFMCLVLETCVYGMDGLLFWTHLGHLIIHFFAASYYLDLHRVIDALKAHVAFRVLWFTTIKACINTIMVMTGWKKSGVFKVTPKLGQSAEEAAISTKLSKTENPGQPVKVQSEPFQLHHVHQSLSKVTEVRKRCMPFDGTLDFWVIMLLTLVPLVSMAFGVRDLILSNSLIDFSVDNESIKWLAIVWALHEAMPGLIFIGYLASYNTYPRFLKFWVPLITIGTALSIIFVEFRIALGISLGI